MPDLLCYHLNPHIRVIRSRKNVHFFDGVFHTFLAVDFTYNGRNCLKKAL